MFLHLSVILFMGGGGSLSSGVSVQGGSLSGGSLSGGVSVRETIPRAVKSGWYTSYWNVFLFFFYSQCMAD